MWEIANLTPYKTERTWFMDKEGRNHWSLAVKATFTVQEDGTAVPAEDPEDILYVPKYGGEPGTSSVSAEADLTGPKAATDVLVHGSAHAPNGRPTDTVMVRLRVGSHIDKTLCVQGDRQWMAGVTGPRVSRPLPFVVMPITYERAFGGRDVEHEDPRRHRIYDSNPIGSGFAVTRSTVIGKGLPNVEVPSALVRGWNDRPAPAGLGPVACDWSPRRELAGTYDDAWKETRFPLWAEDFDPRYFQAAPADQQVGCKLRGGEVVEVVNMSPDSLWRFPLPKIHLSFLTAFGKEQVHHGASLATVTLIPDRRRVLMSWQSFLPCHHRADELDYTVVTEKPYL